jgi:hypothetical protein
MGKSEGGVVSRRNHRSTGIAQSGTIACNPVGRHCPVCHVEEVANILAQDSITFTDAVNGGKGATLLAGAGEPC